MVAACAVPTLWVVWKRPPSFPGSPALEFHGAPIPRTSTNNNHNLLGKFLAILQKVLSLAGSKESAWRIWYLKIKRTTREKYSCARLCESLALKLKHGKKVERAWTCCVNLALRRINNCYWRKSLNNSFSLSLNSAMQIRDNALRKRFLLKIYMILQNK